MRKVLFSIALSFLCSFSFAQTQVKLTFRDAVKIGLENNILLNQQRNQLNYTQVNKVSRLLQLGPTAQLNGSAYRNDGNSFNNQTGDVINGVVDYVNGSINANMPIFNGFGQMNAYRQANNQNEAQLHQVNRSNQDAIRDIANQYLTCLLDEQLIKIDEENLAVQKLQYDQIKELVDLGSKAEADLYNQEYQLKNAELLLVRSRNKLKNDIANLSQTLLIDPMIKYELEPVDWDINKLVADTVTLEQMYAVARERRSDLKQANYSERAAHFGYSATKGFYFPSLNAGASYGSRYNYIYGGSNRSFNDQFSQDNTQLSYGLSLTIPIYNAFQYRSQTALSRVTYENAKLRTKSTEVTVQGDVIRTYQNFKDAKASFEASAAQLKAAELSYNMEKERYDLGISNIIQVTTINQAHVRAKSDYQNAVFTLMFQRLLMDYAMGTLSFEDIP